MCLSNTFSFIGRAIGKHRTVRLSAGVKNWKELLNLDPTPTAVIPPLKVLLSCESLESTLKSQCSRQNELTRSLSGKKIKVCFFDFLLSENTSNIHVELERGSRNHLVNALTTALRKRKDRIGEGRFF